MKTKMRVGFLSCWGVLLALWPHGVGAGEASAAPIEIGRVAWFRDLDDGLARAKATGKAADVLKRYGEPAWNFQVVRFLTADGKDLIPREDKVWTVPAPAKRMVRSLKMAGLPASEALQHLAGRLAVAASPLQKVAFAQACFWVGEMQLGQIEGVERTEAGYFEGREVTLVEFNSQRVALPDLVKAMLARQCADRIYTATPIDKSSAETVVAGRRVGLLDASYRVAPASDQKKQIQGPSAQGRFLKPEQATKVNAFIRHRSGRGRALPGRSTAITE